MRAYSAEVNQVAGNHLSIKRKRKVKIAKKEVGTKCRIGFYSPEKVLPFAIHPNIHKELIGRGLKINDPEYIEKACRIYDGEIVKMASWRYQTFNHSGLKCHCCGLEGTYFALEHSRGNKRFHFNLYAIDNQGNEVLMTKDHIKSKAQGGRDFLENLQTLCSRCNHKKGKKENQHLTNHWEQKTPRNQLITIFGCIMGHRSNLSQGIINSDQFVKVTKSLFKQINKILEYPDLNKWEKP